MFNENQNYCQFNENLFVNDEKLDKFVILNKNGIRMRTITIFLVLPLIMLSVRSNAAVNAQYGFEDGVPAFVTVNGNGEVTFSGERFKDGANSLKFSWTGQSELVFNDFLAIEASMKVNGAGIMVWIYNTVPVDAPLRFTFKDWNDGEICHFDFNMNFRGWRTAWIKYIDMHLPDGRYYGDLKVADRPVNVSKMTVSTPPSVPAGTIYVDRLSFRTVKLHDQITPDMQIPDNNNHLARNMWHWCRLWEWEQYPELQAEPVGEEQKAMLSAVEERIDKMMAGGLSSAAYVKNTLLKRADDSYVKYGLKRLPDGSVTGAPLLSDDEFNNSLGEMRIRYIGQLVYYYAQDWFYTGNRANLDKVFTAMDHAIDQGFAFGSGQGTNHHYGYQVRELYKGMWLLRKEIAAAGKTDEYVRVLEYWSGLAETRLPFQKGRDEMLDSWHTLLECKLVAAMMNPSDDVRYAKMKALGVWLSGSLGYSPGTLGGIKPDGTSFHHGGLYPAYSVGAFAALGDYCRCTAGTDFTIDEDARKCFKHALLTMRDYCNLTDWGLGVCGRHPFNGFIPKADINAFASLALLGDLTGSGMAADPELGGAYLYLGAPDEELAAEIRKAGITSSGAPQGFFVLNYGAMGIHRRDNWMLVLKAYNSDVWSSEIYAADNRYGRYQSYGSAQLIGSGNPVSAEASGFSQEGWDWNRVPGATTIHLPFDMLENPLKGTLMERNDSRFPGVSSLDGKNGVLAFTYVERDRQNFCPGATATKSVFCFDNRIVFIGSGISNDSQYPTETTLYQLRLDDRNAEVDVNEEWLDAFPATYHFQGGGQAVLTDTKGNTYIIRDASGLTVLKQNQTSPSDTKKKTGTGDFVTAYIDHGVSPSEASYEYMMLVRPAGKDVNRYSRNLPYTVIRNDSGAHVVNDHVTGITAYVCYSAYDGAASAESFASLPSGKDSRPYLPVLSIDAETIVMEHALDGGGAVMSICTPDLGITQKGYTTAQPSQPILKKVVLDGVYSLDGNYMNVELSSEGGRTEITATCLDGQPVEFRLMKK